MDKEYYSLDENELLTRKVIDGGHEFHAIYLPSVLIFQVLQTAHDDLGIGEFHPPTSHGHHYALTAVCMLTGFTWCVPLKTKTAEEVAKAYMDHIYCNFGGSIKILTDNGTEFKNKLFKEVVNKLGTEFSIHSPPYRPQSNGKIEGFHRFLKTCIGKHINYGLEWDELTPMATACYNFFPNCSARESAFFVMFGRDPINKPDAIFMMIMDFQI